MASKKKRGGRRRGPTPRSSKPTERLHDGGRDPELTLAIQHHDAGYTREATTLYWSVLERDPSNAVALERLGFIAALEGRSPDAVDLAGRAVSADQTLAAGHNTLGFALRRQGELGAAVAAFEAAVERALGNSDYYNNLGEARQASGDLDAAIVAFRRAVELRPRFAGVHANLGTALAAAKHLDGAIEAFRAALTLAVSGESPNAIPMLEFTVAGQLGTALLVRGDVADAIAAFEAALTKNPGSAEIGSAILYARHFDPAFGPAELLAAHREWAMRFTGSIRRLSVPPRRRPPEGRIRIGYVSPDFRHSVVGHNLLPLLRNHDRERFEIFCYSLQPSTDETAAEIRTLADHWRDLDAQDDSNASRRIAADQVDVLVDLALHTAGNRMCVFAYQPSSVQVTYLAYPGTSGLDAMSHRLSDPFLDATEDDLAGYSEQTVRLPETYWCYEPIGPLPEPVRGPTREQILFGSLNRAAKISEPTVDAWARLLAAVDQSRLLLFSPSAIATARLRTAFEVRGVDPARIEFVGDQLWDDYIRTYDGIDIALDTFPHGGGITTCDALSMGVPVIVLAGATGVSRGGRSILSNIGLAEFVANTPEDYVAIATELATNPERLATLRATIRDRLAASPLCNPQRFTHDVETVFEQLAQPPSEDPVTTDEARASSVFSPTYEGTDRG